MQLDNFLTFEARQIETTVGAQGGRKSLLPGNEQNFEKTEKHAVRVGAYLEARYPTSGVFFLCRIGLKVNAAGAKTVLVFHVAILHF